MVPYSRRVVLLPVGLVAGVASGLFGVGGGIVLVPLLVLVGGLGQHEAHATSLAAIVPIALAGAAVFGSEGEVDYGVGLLLAAGALAGVPLGARLMARSPERWLRAGFGVLAVIVGVWLLWP